MDHVSVTVRKDHRDTSKFMAHSVRKAATSHAYVTGTPVIDILKMAIWSSEHVFRRHHFRDVLV